MKITVNYSNEPPRRHLCETSNHRPTNGSAPRVELGQLQHTRHRAAWTQGAATLATAAATAAATHTAAAAAAAVAPRGATVPLTVLRAVQDVREALLVRVGARARVRV